ncbi:MAG: T9SS type A sorting domain-containing protein [Taibaiella sp.]|jgi:hypothetical protein
MKKTFTTRLLYKNILACLLLVIMSMRLNAQSITSYTFAQSTTTFTALTTPTTVSWVGNTDDAVSDLIPIGFDFWYMGTRYTTIGASTNGWLSFGTTLSDYSYTNGLSTGGTPRPVIAPLWDDLDITSNTNVTYKTTGTAGSRIFTLQYLNVKWYYLALGSVISFQVKLYEGTGKIEFIYKPEATSASNPSASIGITATATGSGNFLSVNNAGTSVSSTNEANVTTRPSSGKRYAFTPPVPTAPGSLTFSGVSGTAMTLHWTDLSSNEAGFAIYRSTDGVNYSFVSQAAAGATSSLESGLTVNTTYHWKVYAVSAGALSTVLSGSEVTTCPGPNISNIPVTNLILNYKFNGNANDASGNNNGMLQSAPSLTADRFDNVASAYSFNGSSQYVSTSNSYFDPNSYSMSVWFKTTTASGGLLMGFGSSQTGLSLNYDRNLYMNNAGQIYFGSNPTGGNATAINSALSYNDNNWHLATATISATAGMILYIDGVQAATNAAITSSQNFTGYWRVGFDNVQWWPSAPTSNYFNGTLDDALVYHSALTPAEVATLYNAPDGAGSNAPICAGTSLNLTATTVASSTYAWTGPNGFTSSAQNPSFAYSAAYAGVYEVEVTAASCPTTPSIAYVKVASTTIVGQWTGNVSSDWANADNWCDGLVPSTSTDVTIVAGASNMPAITSSVHCRNLTIGTGATVTLNSSGTLNISGTLTNSGTFTNNGTVNFNGTSGQQTFSGVASFYNLTLNNTAGLLLPATITVNNNLTISAGTLSANNFNITVKGNWTNNSGTAAFTAGTGTVTFNGTIAKTIGGSFATTFNNLTVADSGNVVTLNANASITGNLMVSGGTLDLAGFTANRATSGGTLTVANNATLKIGGTNTYPTNYTTNTLVVASTVEYSGTNQTIANQTYGNLKLSSSSGSVVKTFPGTALTVVGNLSSVLGSGTALSLTAAANITVNGNVSIGASTTFNGGSYSHNIGGNWANSGTFTGNTSTVTFSGAGTTISGSGTQSFNNLTVAASSVSFSTGSVALTGNLSTTGAGSFSQASGGNLIMSGTTKTISGSGISLDNLTVSGSVSTSTLLVLTGNLSVSGSFTSTGTVTMSGTSKTISGAGTIIFATLFATGSITADANFSVSSGLVVNGSLSASAGTATFTGTSTLSGTPNLFSINIDGTSLQLSANSILGIANAMTITAGNLNVTSTIPNTVNFNGTGAQNINAITYCNLVLSNGNTKTAAGAITTTNDLTIGTGTTLDPSFNTLSIYGDWINNGTFVPATSTVQFLGPAVAYLTGATTFNILTSNTSNATTQLFLNSNISVATLNVTNGIIVTGSNTITITGTRTGPGFIYGNIQRTHAFTTGVPYAFEGPENTITFSSVSSVNSVTVSVVQGGIGDFPFSGSISRVYNVTVPSGIYTATLRLHYEGDELNGNSESSMGLWRYDGSAWGSIGKTANSTTSNYVEQSGLTNITNRWTCSDDGNVVQWNGSVSADWNTAANWTVIQGSASAPPSATDIVNLGTITFINQPTISNTVNVKNINFGSAQAVTLSMASGGSLTSGDINGTWSSNVIHTINANNQSITINGDLNLSDGTNGHAIDLNIGTGTVTVAGSLSEAGQADISFSGNGVLNIAEDFHYESGVFTAGNGTVIYNGLADQHIAHIDYNHLTLNKGGGIVIVDSIVNIAGDLLISSGELDNSSIINIAGNVTIASGATLQSSYMLHVGGNWVNNGNYVATGAHVIFNGTGTQTISATTFNNLVINKPVGSTAELTGNVALNGDLTITSGAFDIKSFICDRNVPGGAITLADSGTFIIGGNNPPMNFTSGSIANSSTVILDGTVPQTIVGGIDYGNIILRNTGAKTLSTSLTLNGNLTIESGATLNADSNTITLRGNWTNSGTFIPSTGTVVCAGSAKNLTGNTTFNHVTVTGSYTLLGDMTFNGLLNITSTGSFSAGGTVLTTMNGDLINSGVLYTLGTTTFTGNVVQTLSLINAITTVALRVNFNGSVSPVLNSTSVPQFGYLTINNTGGVHPSVGWTILYSLTVGSGATFGGGSSTHNILGAVTNNGTISSSGTLNFIPSSAVPVNLGSNFSSTGTVNFGGAGAMTLSGTPVSFHDVIISNTNVAGITPSSDWTLTNNLLVNSGATLNAGNHSLLVGGNITSSGTINSGTSTFTLNGSGTQNISTASAFNNLTINKASGLTTLSSNVTVNGILNFIAGKMQTGSNRLIQPSSGIVTGAAQNTGWVDGKLQKNIITGATSKTFEIGDTTNYTPVSVAFSNVTTAGDLTAFTTTGDHPNIGSSTINTTETVNRFWTLQNSGIGFTNYNATFNYVPADLDLGVNTSTLIVGKYNGSSWAYPIVGALTSTSLQATGLTSFEDFQVGRMLIFSKTWDGGAGTHNWGDAANWNADGVPAATDDVDLTGSDTININVAATTKNLLLDNASLVLTTNAGNSLSVSGNMTLTNGTFNTAAAFPSVSGTVNVAGGTVGFIGSIPQTIPTYNYNNLISGSTGSRTLANSGIIGITGTFTAGTNTYVTTGSTVDLNSGGAQSIPALHYNNLTLSNAGVKTLDAGTTGIAGTLSITGTAIAKATTNFATVSYNGSANQTITPMTYYGLDISSTGGTVSGSDITLTNFSMNSGTVDLNATTLAIPGTTTCNAGIINNGIVTATGEKTIFAGTTFGAIVQAISDSLYLNGSRFNNNATLTKIGATNIVCSGGNVFNDTTTISNDSIGNFTLGNIAPDTFNEEVVFNNTETATLYIANNSAGNFFNGKVTFNNVGTTGALRNSFDAIATAIYNGNIIVNNTATGGIYFGNIGGLTTLAASKTITIGTTGFTKGILLLRNFTQLGSTAQALTLTGTGLLQIGPASTLNGNVTFNAPQLKLNGCTFGGTAFITKNGATDNISTGGNIYNGITTIQNSGSASLDLGDTSPEQFNADVTINNTGTSRIQLGISSAGNIFNGNVTINNGGNTIGLNTVIARSAGSTVTINGNLILNNTNANVGSGIIVANTGQVTVNGNIIVSSTSGRGILFADADGTVALANGFTISDAGAGSFTTGILSLKAFTQTGNTAQNIALTGTANLSIGLASQFNGAVNFSAPQLFSNGGQYNNTATLTKNGATDNTSTGGNVFSAATTITNSGTGLFRLASTTADDFNSDATFIQTGSGLLQPSYGSNCTIAGNLSTAGTATAITFGGTVTLNGTDAQSIAGSLSPTFNNLTISNVGNTVTPAVNSIVKGNLSVTSGTFDLGTFTANRLTTGGTLTVSDGAKLKIGGTNTIPSNYTAHSIGATSTIEYGGTNQTIDVLNSAQDYGHLTVSGSGTEMNDSITVRNNLSITAGSLDINEYTLKIGGSISNSGTFTASNGTIELNGTVAQTIPASTFVGNRVGHLTIDNTAGATLGGTLDLSGVLLVSNGQLSTGGHLTLLSTDTQTALIDGSGAGEVLGNVTMQRYLPSGFGYKYFSSPFQAATVNEFSDDIDLGASFPTFYRYDENLASSGWVKYLDTTALLIPMHGYTANLGADSTARTVDITGVVNNNAMSALILYNHNQPYTLGFNLVGNPYPSPIDWSILEGWDRTNIDDAVYYFNAGTADQYTGTYSSYINGISSDEHAGYVIPAMQGFFVHVTNGTYPVTGSLSINNNARINDLQPYFHKPEPTTAPLLRLNAGFADERPVSDPVVVYFDSKAQSTFDKEMDALKIMNSDPLVPNLYVNAPGDLYVNAPGATTQSICAWPYLKDTTDVIPLGLKTKQSGWITFSSPVMERMPFGWHIYLYDAKTRSRHILDEKMKYRLHLDAGDYENRFFLMFNETQFPDVEGIFNAYAKDGKLQLLIEGIGNEKCDVSITNMLGQVILRKHFDSKGRYEIDSPFSSGVYVVSFYVNSHVFSQKIYIGN